MLYALIRPNESHKIDVSADSLVGIRDQLAAKLPEGYDLTDAPLTMAAGKTALTAVGTFARRDGVREIEAVDMATLRSLVPEGWIMLSVRSD